MVYFSDAVIDYAITKYGLGYATKSEEAKWQVTTFISRALSSKLSTPEQEDLFSPKRRNIDQALSKVFGEPTKDGSLVCEIDSGDNKDYEIFETVFALKPTKEGFAISTRRSAIDMTSNTLFKKGYNTKKDLDVINYSTEGERLTRDYMEYSDRLSFAECIKVFNTNIEDLEYKHTSFVFGNDAKTDTMEQ